MVVRLFVAFSSSCTIGCPPYLFVAVSCWPWSCFSPYAMHYLVRSLLATMVARSSGYGQWTHCLSSLQYPPYVRNYRRQSLSLVWWPGELQSQRGLYDSGGVLLQLVEVVRSFSVGRAFVFHGPSWQWKNDSSDSRKIVRMEINGGEELHWVRKPSSSMTDNAGEIGGGQWLDLRGV